MFLEEILKKLKNISFKLEETVVTSVAVISLCTK